MKQRVLSFLLAAVLTLTLVPTAWAAETFTDVPSSHWAYSDIMACAEAGIVTGMGDGKFHPNDNVTGIQFIVMLTRTFYNDMVEAAMETEASSWYAPNMKVASDIGMLESNAVVNDSAMSRTEMANVLYNVLNREGKLENVPNVNARAELKDFLSIHYSRTLQVSRCYALGIITGMSDGTFSGNSSMTRAQACAVVSRMIRLMNGETLPRPETPAQPQQPQQPAQTEQPQQPEVPAQTSTGKLANGKDATTENIQAILDSFKQKYPTGTTWGPYGTPNNHENPNEKISPVWSDICQNYVHSSSSARSACGGWAAMVSDTIFGQDTSYVREVKNVADARLGDIAIKMHIDGTGRAHISHVAIVLGVLEPDEQYFNGTNYVSYSRWCVLTCDGNVGGGRYWDGEHIGKVDWNMSFTCDGLGEDNVFYKDYYRIFTRY